MLTCSRGWHGVLGSVDYIETVQESIYICLHMIVFIYIAFLQYYKNYNKENMGKPPQKQTKTILNLSTVSDIPKIIHFGSSDCYVEDVQDRACN